MDQGTAKHALLSPQHWFLGEGGELRPLWRAILFVILCFVLYLLLAPAMYTVAREWPREIKWALQFLVLGGAFLLQSWLLLKAFDRRRFRTLGLWFYRGWVREFAVGWLLSAALMGSVVVALVATRALTYHGDAEDGLAKILLWAVLLLLSAAWEEIAFRGYGMQRLMEALGEPGGILAFSALFALLHLRNPDANLLSTVNTFLAGVLLGLAYLKTRALWLPIGLHWSWNVLMGQVFSLPISGMYFAPRLFQVEVAGPEWLSGGSYGPEGSIVLTVACVLAILWLGQTNSISPSPAMEESIE